MSEIASYRVTDLHQPKTVSLLATPVPKCPEDPNTRETDASGETEEDVESERLSDGVIQDVLKLLEGVDIGFLRRRKRYPEASAKRIQTPLMDVFEDRYPDIFRICESGTGRKHGNCSQKGTKRAQPQHEVDCVETPKNSKIRVDLHVSKNMSKSTGSARMKSKSRVSLKHTGSLSGRCTMNKEEEVQEAIKNTRAVFDRYTRTIPDKDSINFDAWIEGANITKVLKDLQVFHSDILRLSSHAEAFQKLPRETWLSVMDILSLITSNGSKILLTYRSQKEDYLRVLAALEAVILIERLTTLVSQALVISEEKLILCIETTRFHLYSNVLPFYDAKMRMAVRPDMDGQVQGRPKHKSSDANSGQDQGDKLPKAIEDSIDRILISLDIIGEIISALKVQTPVLTPLVRTVIQVLTVEDIPELHLTAVRLLAAVYSACPDLRHSILNDVFMALTPFLGVGKKYKRDIQLVFEIGSMKSVTVMSALILHTVQMCAQLPSVASGEETKKSYATCIKAADWFWELCMERVGSAKTMKMETDADFSFAVLGIVQDLLEVSSSIYWPCASCILIRLVSLLNSKVGLHSQDSLVRQSCVDIVGRILAFVHRDSTMLNNNTDRFDSMIQNTAYDSISDAARDLVLSYLASPGVDIVPSAKRFLWLQKLCEQYATLEMTTQDSEQLQYQYSKAFMEISESLSRLDDVHETNFLDDDATLVMKAVVHEQFLSAAPAMLSWLIEILESKQYSSSVRSRVVRALGDVASVDKRLLDVTSLLSAIEHALQDDSISVREAALVLIGKHMVQDPSLAMRLLHIIIKATEDPGSSVRRSAIRILRDCVLVIPNQHQEKALDAYRAILNKVTDNEESVKSVVVKTFKAIWFGTAIEGEDGMKVVRSPSDRAQTMASLSQAVATSMPRNSSGVRNLIDKSNPLIVVLNEIREGDKDEGQVDNNSEDEYLKTSAALLECFVYSKDSRLPYLYAMYAMVQSNPAFCIPKTDPLRFLRSLAPQIKMLCTDEAQMNHGYTEEVLYVLGILSSILIGMENSPMIVMDIATDISEELPSLINTHKFTVIVSAACACLSACALSSPTATGRFLNVTAQYLNFLENPMAHLKNLPRFLFIVGQVYRHGSRLLQQVDLYLPDQPYLAQKLTSEACMKLLLGFWTNAVDGSPALAAQIQRNSLEAICQLMISSPWLALEGVSGAQNAITEALKVKSPPLVRLAALNGLIELLQADAQALDKRQNLTSSGVKKEAILSTSYDGKPAVAAENGDGESSYGSAVLQIHWDSILSLAGESRPNQKSAEPLWISIKKRILFLIEIAVRDGLVGPWTAVPTLVLLTMDANAGQDICLRSIKLLKTLSNKYPQYVDAGRLAKGVKDSYALYMKDVLRKGKEQGHCVPECIRQAQSCLKRMYTDILSANRSKRNEFLRLLIRSFKEEIVSRKEARCRPSFGPDDANYPPSLWPWLAVVISSIPFKKAEEICVVVHEIDAVIAYKVSSTAAELHEFIESDTPVTHPSVKQCASRAKLLCTLVRLKTYLMKGYGISVEKQAIYSTGTKRSSTGKTKIPSEGLFLDPVHFSARNASTDGGKGSELYGIFSFKEDPESSQIVPCTLHPLSQGSSLITPVENLRELFDELDMASDGNGADDFDPVDI